MKKLIIPGILTDTLDDLQAKIDQASQFSKRICIDVIDGGFADNLTVMPESFSELNFHNLKVDVQLMTTEPVDYLEFLHTAKIDRVYGHVERMSNINEFIDECKAMSVSAGLAYDLYTPTDAASEDQLEQVGGVLLMSVKAGFSGQEFVDISQKIINFRENGFTGNVVVDGGMNAKTIPTVVRAGANQVSVTSAIWKDKNPGLRYKELVDLLE